MRTVVPKTDDGRMRFEAVGNDLKVGFKEAEDRGDDDVEGDDDVIGLLRPPLEVMLCAYLNRRGKSKGEGYNRLVVGKMEQLTGPETLVLKGSKLPVRPPVLGSSNVFQKFGRIGREGASSVFRGDY